MYQVIEYTPGYLSEDDDPPIFDQWAEAQNYVLAERQFLLDDIGNYEEEQLPTNMMPDLVFALDVGNFDEDRFIYYDKRKIHDLGRIVQIVPVEED